MINTKDILRIAAFVMMPIAIIGMMNLLAKKEAVVDSNQAAERQIKDDRAGKIDSHFADKGSPLAGLGFKFVEAADKCGLNAFLLPAIGVQESEAGKRMLPGTFNAWGWDHGKTKFRSFEQAIEFIGGRLCGSPIYSGKTTEEILKIYNPPGLDSGYSAKIFKIMAAIDRPRVTPQCSGIGEG